MASRILRVALILTSIESAINKIVTPPQSIAALVGESVRITCESDIINEPVEFVSWRPGGSESKNIRLIYEIRILAERLRSRMSVERNGGIFTLVIRSVGLDDGGTYRCVDDGGIGQRAVAQLIVIDPSVTCFHNIRAEGVIADDVTNCLHEPDYLEMSCSVRYDGNVFPIVNWRHSGKAVENVVVEKRSGIVKFTAKTTVSISDEGTTFDYDVSMPGNILLGNGVAALRNATPSIRVLYLTASKITRDDPKLPCPIKTNFNLANCASTHAYTRNDETLTSYALDYVCVSRCTVANKTCTVSSQVLSVKGRDDTVVVDPSPDTIKRISIALCIVASVVIVIQTIALIWFYRNRRRTRQL
jgi:hypothetical protein